MKIYYRKSYVEKIKKALVKEKLVLLVWARQVWKTTILNIIKNKIRSRNKLYINFEDFFSLKFNSKQDFINWVKFEYWFDFNADWYLFLDEAQYLNDPESLLKALYDDKEIKTKFIVTWSRFWWQKKIWSSLIWRWEIIKIFSFDFFEFLEAKWKNISVFKDIKSIDDSIFNSISPYLHEYLHYWWYPSVVFAETKEDKIKETKKILERFFEKDFLYFMKSGDIFGFKKVFQFLSLNVWNIIKIDWIASHLGLSRYKVTQFIQFLIDSYLIYEIYPFFTDKSKEYNQHAKIYFNDLWFLRYIKWGLEENFQDWKINENFVFLQLLKNIKYKQISYYHKITWSEIDFIVENNDWKLIPIESKSSENYKLPKIFHVFDRTYWDKIESFILTSKSQIAKDKVNDKNLSIRPFWLI